MTPNFAWKATHHSVARTLPGRDLAIGQPRHPGRKLIRPDRLGDRQRHLDGSLGLISHDLPCGNLRPVSLA